MTAADVLVETLLDWGVEVVFGLPGDGINGIMESLRTHENKIRFVQVRHEEAAAFMACGYAKFTGRLGVCLATSGPGGIHLLNGLYDAKLDNRCGRALDEFLAAPGPAILQAAVDPFEPPMPAKVKADQALHFAESLARGEPNRKKIALTAVSDRVRELI